MAGRGEAIPLASRSVDLAFLSMVYHHLVAAEALPELGRIVRSGGYVIVGNATRECLGAASLYQRFFPDALAVSLARMPPRKGLAAAFGGHGFALVGHRIIRQRFADNHADYLRKIKLRGFSSLQLISDEAFAQGLAALRRYCRTVERDGPIDEMVDLFLFRRNE